MTPFPLWSYDDTRGVPHIGRMERYHDFGGTDQTAVMRDIETGELSMVSGQRLKAMRRMIKNPNK